MKKLISIAFGGLLVGVGFAGAEPYPTRPITIVVPAAAGGSLDTVVRIMAPRMRASLDQPIIVEDVAGASGIIGLGRVSRAAPDGYTITAVAFDHVISGAVLALPYDVANDFEPISLVADGPQLIVAKNAYSKDLLSVARVIGLPLEQGLAIVLAEKFPYAPLETITLEQAIARAASTRADLKSALAQVRSAELSRNAASAQRLPYLTADADYGATGITPGTSVATFHVIGSIRLPIFEGGRIRGDVMQADAALQQQRSRANDLRLQVEFEVRTAFLDLSSTADQVRVTVSGVSAGRVGARSAENFPASAEMTRTGWRSCAVEKSFQPFSSSLRRRRSRSPRW